MIEINLINTRLERKNLFFHFKTSAAIYKSEKPNYSDLIKPELTEWGLINQQEPKLPLEWVLGFTLVICGKSLVHALGLEWFMNEKRFN